MEDLVVDFLVIQEVLVNSQTTGIRAMPQLDMGNNH